MSAKQFPRSRRKFLRRKKAEIRRQFLSSPESEARIRALVADSVRRYNQGKVSDGVPIH